jgi:ketosteroid isomerase-like protein
MTTDPTARPTAEVIDLFNQAFVTHDPALLADLVAADCVMEAVEPAPDGARHTGLDACLEFWRALAADTSSQFEPEEVLVHGDRATIRWHYRYGAGPGDRVRGVNLLHVRDGRIVEALGYTKAPLAPVAPLAGER